jgi:hypothetical protein
MENQFDKSGNLTITVVCGKMRGGYYGQNIFIEKWLVALLSEKSEAIVKNEKLKLAEFRLQEIERVLTGGILNRFDDDLFRNLIERATLAGNTITFHLLSGLEFTEQLDAPTEVKVYGI